MEFSTTHLGEVDGVQIEMKKRRDGLPMRAIANGRRSRPVGQFYSTKNGFAVPWESRGELHGLYHAEVRSDVVSYQAQPFTFEIGIGRDRQSFTPDLGLKLDTGRPEIVEVKDDLMKVDRDPLYRSKVNIAARACASVGWHFRLIDREELECEPQFSAVEQVQAFRRTMVTAADIRVAGQLLQEPDGASFGDLKRSLADPVVGHAKACALIVKRVIEVDYSGGLSDTAAVRLIRKNGVRHD